MAASRTLMSHSRWRQRAPPGSRLARERAAGAADLPAGGSHIGHADGHVPESGAEVVAVDAVVVGELEHRVLALIAVSHERQRVLLLGAIGRAQQVHAERFGV